MSDIFNMVAIAAWLALAFSRAVRFVESQDQDRAWHLIVIWLCLLFAIIDVYQIATGSRG